MTEKLSYPTKCCFCGEKFFALPSLHQQQRIDNCGYMDCPACGASLSLMICPDFDGKYMISIPLEPGEVYATIKA